VQGPDDDVPQVTRVERAAAEPVLPLDLFRSRLIAVWSALALPLFVSKACTMTYYWPSGGG
jgi:hypothetical protein